MFQQLRLHQRQLAVLGARRDKTGADSVTSFWSSQSVFLIGPHTPATLGTRPGSNVWTIQKKSYEEVLSKFQQYFQTKLCSKKM